MFEFDRSKIIETLAAKPSLLSTAFSMACARRLLNSLDNRSAGGISSSVAMHLWEEIWRSAVNGAALPLFLTEQIVNAIPDEDDDPSLAAGVWDDALAALLFAGDTLSTSSIEPSCNAASRAIDTAFRYSTQVLNETELTAPSFHYILEGEVVQTELARQHRDLEDVIRTIDSARVTADLIVTRAVAEAVLPSLLRYDTIAQM